MIKGVGVDSVYCPRIARLSAHTELYDIFIRRTFSLEERRRAPTSGDRQSEYYAAHFAAKEAVFKAVAHLLPEKFFDFRIVEISSFQDGCPYVKINAELQGLLSLAGIDTLHISITTEADVATAFVIASQK